MKYVCPSNGEIRECGTCKDEAPHIRIEWVNKGQKVPTCQEHQTELIPGQ